MPPPAQIDGRGRPPQKNRERESSRSSHVLGVGRKRLDDGVLAELEDNGLAPHAEEELVVVVLLRDEKILRHEDVVVVTAVRDVDLVAGRHLSAASHHQAPSVKNHLGIRDLGSRVSGSAMQCTCSMLRR